MWKPCQADGPRLSSGEEGRPWGGGWQCESMPHEAQPPPAVGSMHGPPVILWSCSALRGAFIIRDLIYFLVNWVTSVATGWHCDNVLVLFGVMDCI